jgi:hypothetical protein
VTTETSALARDVERLTAPEPGGGAPGAPASTGRPGRPEAAAAIWDWRGRRPSTVGAHDRRRGAIRAVVGAAIGAILLAIGWTTVGTVALVLAGLSLALAIVAPHHLARITAGLASAVRTVTTWVLMTVIFYAVFVPFHLLARRGRRDAMKRFYDRAQASYWHRRAGAPSRYERPF